MAKAVKTKDVKAVIAIDETNYKLIFGLKFLKEIGMLPNSSTDNTVAFSEMVGGIMEFDPFSLLKALKASLITYDDLDEKAIEEWFETTEQVDWLFENFTKFLESAPLTAKKTKQLMVYFKKAMAEMEIPEV
jgi:hypothetical protein